MSTLFTRILVPCDATPHADEGVEVARRLAQRFGASLLLLHVEPHLVSTDEVIQDDDRFSRQVQALRDQGIDAHFSFEYDRPEQAITHVATAERADLIVLTAPSQTYPHLSLHPSVTEKVLERAPVPVLVWPAKEHCTPIPNLLTFTGSVVLLPVDGSALAEQAIPYAVQLAKAFRRPLVLVRVVEQKSLPGIGLAVRRLKIESRHEELHAAQRYLADLRRYIVQQTGVSVQSILVNGDPTEELVRLAQTHEGSVMVMSTHGRTGLDRLLIGSVAATVACDTPLPVLIIPPRARRKAVISKMARDAQPVTVR